MFVNGPNIRNYGPPKLKPRQTHPLLAQLEIDACANSIKDYEKELLVYFQELQEYDTPNPKMIDNQPELEWYMRPYLLDFLIDLHRALKLSEPTLFLAIQIMDRYCSKRIVYQKHYQLVTTTTLWIAAKIEDKKHKTPTLNQLTSACSRVYESYMFVQMESHILETLDWKVRSCFTTVEAIQLCFKDAEIIWPMEDVSMLQIVSIFFAELSCYDKHYMTFSSSVKASAAIMLASILLGDNCFQKHISAILQEFSDINTETLSIDSAGQHGINTYFEDDSFSIICAPLLRIDESTPTDIRRCCLLYLNDIFKPLTANKELPKALVRKYEKMFLQDYIDAYTSHNIETYLHLCKLTQALLNTMHDRKQLIEQINMVTDLMVGLELQHEGFALNELPLKFYQNPVLPCSNEIKEEIIETEDIQRQNCSRSSIDTTSPWTPASVFSAKRSLSDASSLDNELDLGDVPKTKDPRILRLPTPLRNSVSTVFDRDI
ncbi:unnamed protein product [Kluyveromyces dobzhanskii CBS 2104]|uniref:WGS project CCBQ000000000 data, contig MAT n=1 Tax=Kluyveromyces dobzhanskii CBS 2104 TaxID=1427455 RepID=A0A0A8L1P5_9SACH|nr:unnamed protein product [Kluyveromyces dobzhanskii CBS 2104]